MVPPAVPILPLLGSLLLLLACHRADAECEPVACGNLTIKYPFWLGAASQPTPEPACGPPAFELWCTGNGTGNTTSASMRGSNIHVHGINYAARTFVATHARVATGNDGVCRTDLNVSSSIALSPFRISASNRALCFLYNCYGAKPPLGDGFVNATAVPSCGRQIYAYLGGGYDRDVPPVIAAGRCTYSYMPVLGSVAANATAADYGRLLKTGFLLEWGVAGIGDCDACGAKSGGECRYSNASAGLACLCPRRRRKEAAARLDMRRAWQLDLENLPRISRSIFPYRGLLSEAVRESTSRTPAVTAHSASSAIMAPKVDFRAWHEPPPDYGTPESPFPTMLRVVVVGFR